MTDLTSRTKLLIVTPSYHRAIDFIRESGILEREVSLALEDREAYGLRGGFFVDLWFSQAGRFDVNTKIRNILLRYAEFEELDEAGFVLAVKQKRGLLRAKPA